MDKVLTAGLLALGPVSKNANVLVIYNKKNGFASVFLRNFLRKWRAVGSEPSRLAGSRRAFGPAGWGFFSSLDWIP
jgi:hypothetical protein